MHLSDTEKSAVVSSWSNVNSSLLDSVLLQLVQENADMRAAMSRGDLAEDSIREQETFKADVTKLTCCITKLVTRLGNTGEVSSCPATCLKNCPYLQPKHVPLFISSFCDKLELTEDAKKGWKFIMEKTAERIE